MCHGLIVTVLSLCILILFCILLGSGHIERERGKISVCMYSYVYLLSEPYCVTKRASVQPISHRLSLRPQTFICEQTAIHSPDLPFNGLQEVVR